MPWVTICPKYISHGLAQNCGRICALTDHPLTSVCVTARPLEFILKAFRYTRILFSCGATAQLWPKSPHCWRFYITLTHTHTHTLTHTHTHTHPHTHTLHTHIHTHTHTHTQHTHTHTHIHTHTHTHTTHHTHTHTHTLTYSTVQSPSWEANWFAASQEIPRISWNPKVHYRTHKRPPPVSIKKNSACERFLTKIFTGRGC